jgi:hypothetical protein
LGLGFLAFLFVQTCRSQTHSPPEMNTADAGVRAADVEAAVAVICPARDFTRAKNGSVSGCRTCPEGTDFVGDAQSNWELYAQTRGHFTSPQDDNLLLDGAGCDPHSMNFGGSFMFSLKTGKPRLLKYDQGLISDQCHKFAYSDGRDFLVCRGGWTGMGENDATVFTTAFDATGKDMTTSLITVRDATYACDEDSTEPVHNSDIKDIQFSMKDSGEITGLTITATSGTINCSQAKIAKKTKKLPAAVKTYQIEFHFDGKHFMVAPASKVAFDRLNVN